MIPILRSTIELRGVVAAVTAVIAVFAIAAPGYPQNSWDEPPSFADADAVEVPAGKFAVIIDLDNFLLHFRRGEETLWSATVGIGTGIRLAEGDREWVFSTPRGEYQVQYKERDPVWVVPDWYFIEEELPIPPENSPERRIPGGLGAAAIFLNGQLAIHGTDKPELLGRQVSHGCIRVSNANALRLLHNVQVGTPVIIVGDPPPLSEEEFLRLTAEVEELRSKPRTPKVDPLDLAVTEALLADLEDVLRGDAGSDAPTWSALAGQLVRRGIDGDDEALEGFFEIVADLDDDPAGGELGTFVVDAYGRAPARSLQILAELTERERERVTRVLVGSAMAVYAGSPADRQAPWPTRRIPEAVLDADGQRGWQALRAAEEDLRAEVL